MHNCSVFEILIDLAIHFFKQKHVPSLNPTTPGIIASETLESGQRSSNQFESL